MSKEYTLIGGNGTVVSPLEVTEDGDYVAGDSRAFNPVKVRASGSGSSTLSGLTDVDISNPTDGQTLVYDATSQKWVNGSGGGASAYFIDCVYSLDESYEVNVTSSKTAAEIRAAMESGALVYIRYIVPGSNGVPDLTYIYSLTGMKFGTADGVTAVMFSFIGAAADGSVMLMCTQYTMMSDNPVFAQSNK